jgi:two-component system, NarL family, response regulator, fimbrial Z protein, FimZ
VSVTCFPLQNGSPRGATRVASEFGCSSPRRATTLAVPKAVPMVREGGDEPASKRGVSLVPMGTQTRSTTGGRVSRPAARCQRLVVVVAPAPVKRKLTAILQAAGFGVTAATGPEPADAIVLGITAPKKDAAAIVRARATSGSTPLLIAVSQATPADARRLLVDGVAGMVLQEQAEDALAPTLRAVLSGQVAYPAELMPSHLRRTLSTREKQVLGMVVLGFSNAEIAAKLYVSESTVKSHLSSAFAKLGVRSRKDAVALILDPDAGFGTGILAITDSA